MSNKSIDKNTFANYICSIMSINIQKTLTRLNEIMTDAEIGAEIGASQSIVSRLRTGRHRSTYYERAYSIRELAIKRGVFDTDYNLE